MFKDRDKALRQMEEALLEEELHDELEDILEEDWEEDFAEDALEEADFDFPVYNTDITDEDLDSYSDDVAGGPQKENLLGLWILALALLAGILAVVLYWFFRFWNR